MKKNIYFLLTLILTILILVTSCGKDDNPLKPELNTCQGVTKTIDSTFVLEYSHPIVGVHIYDANRDCSYCMKVQLRYNRC